MTNLRTVNRRLVMNSSCILLDGPEIAARMLEAYGEFERRPGEAAKEFVGRCASEDGEEEWVSCLLGLANIAILYLEEQMVESGKFKPPRTIFHTHRLAQ